MRRLVLFHRWLGLLTALLILAPAITAIAINHRARLFPSREAVGSGPFDQYVLCTTVDPRRPSTLWVGTSDGLFRSPDGGRSFTRVTLPVPAKQVNSVCCDGRGQIYAALRNGGIFVSSDDGSAWRAVQTPTNEEIWAASLDPVGHLVAITSAGVRTLSPSNPPLVARPPAQDTSGNRWLQLAYDLHDGRLWGDWGVYITDAAAIALIALVISGTMMFARLRRGERRREV